jgi:membrane protein DedA with SNARE-associated domain
MAGWLIDHLFALPAWVVLLMAFALPGLESAAFVGFLFPGETALLVAGVISGRGHLPVWGVILVGILGAALGDAVGYSVGRRWGRRLLDGTVGRVVKPEQIDRAQHTIARWGGKAVFIGRFTVALRVMVPGIAGMAGIPRRTFTIWNVAGAVVWAPVVVLLGYLGGSEWHRFGHAASLVGWIMVGMAVVFGAGPHLWRPCLRGLVWTARAVWRAVVATFRPAVRTN